MKTLKETETRIKSLELILRDLRVKQKKAKKSLSVVSAEQNVKKKQERMRIRELRKAGLTEKDLRRAIRKTIFPRQLKVELTDEEKNKLNRIVDEDDTSEQVKAFLHSVTNSLKKTAYLENLKRN